MPAQYRIVPSRIPGPPDTARAGRRSTLDVASMKILIAYATDMFLAAGFHVSMRIAPGPCSVEIVR